MITKELIKTSLDERIDREANIIKIASKFLSEIQELIEYFEYLFLNKSFLKLEKPYFFAQL